MDKTRTPPKLYEVPLDNGTTWKGTKRELLETHPDWLPYAQEVPHATGSGKRTEQHAIPPRRSATAEQLAARQKAQQPQRTTTNNQSIQQRPSRASQANPGYAGYHAGLQPEPDEAPYWASEDLENGEPDEPAYPKTHTTSVNWQTTQGSPKQTRNMYPQSKPTRRLERARLPGLLLVCLGFVLFVMLAGWLFFSFVGTWWQTTQDDWHYGRPRTFQVDAVVGHGDSAAHPSHFLALNLNRQIIVIEIPGGNPAQAKTYLGPTLVGDGQELTPVTVSFEEGAHPGKPDMYIHIGDQVIVFLNNGQQFVAPPPPH